MVRKTKKDMMAEADRLIDSLAKPSEESLERASFGDVCTIWWRRDARMKAGSISCHCSACGEDFVLQERDGVPFRCPRCGRKCDAKERCDHTGAGISFYDERKNLVSFDSAGGWEFLRWYNCAMRGSTTKGTAAKTAFLAFVWCFPPDPEKPVMMKRTRVKSCYCGGCNYWDVDPDSGLEWRKPESRFEFEWEPFGTPSMSEAFRYFVPRKGIAESLVEYMDAIRKRHRPMLETAYNLGMFNLACQFISGASREGQIGRYEPEIRMAIRRGWDVGREWLDAIDEIRRDGKANLLRSDKWLEPSALSGKANRLREKKAREIELEYERKQLRSAMRYEQRYEREHRKEIGGSALVGPYEIRPLRSVGEFFEEGKEMRHCVFRCKYYRNRNSVILTVRKGGKRVETCEWGKKEKRILQLYGPDDSRQKCQDEVADAIRKAMPCILKGRKETIQL